ncbi:FliM/FliN family flagellar motor switch protein [Fuscovulum blasticum]|uniref:FliM/FliN family flagellar motor switch protein n=1 Tax=Fuscovulum blasticum TaxID=1075 RepID=UPI000D3E72BE|nr:FliM/FliN family flagellar motor switch protein [Fuscovulum blasticum]AWD20956.1 hypothetical protein B6K69_04130 [Fuscovulum blasticum]
MNDILRRKVTSGSAAEGSPGADHGWRLAFARAARDGVGLLLTVTDLQIARRGLAELLDLPPDRALIALLDGPAGGLGLIALSPDLTAALIERQTIGRVAPQSPAPRRPTRTDAAMVTGVIDRALIELEALLADEADLLWAGGFRYASFLEDPRPLGLLLEDQPYRVLQLAVSMADGARSGHVLLALPAESRGRLPGGMPADGPAGETPPEGATAFAQGLAEAVSGAGVTLDAVIARLSLPLSAVTGLAPGLVLPLPEAALDRIALQGGDGRSVARATLGQHRGQRALRLAAPEAGQGAVAVIPPPGQRPQDRPAVNGPAFGDGADPAFLATG